MRITYSSKGDFEKATDWLNGVSTKDTTSILKVIASEGTKSLRDATPKVTGETASGWVDTITLNREGGEIVWTNVAHPGLSVNLAKLIDLGHGTGTGGYVPPRPYIKNAMRPIWDTIDQKILKELTK